MTYLLSLLSAAVFVWCLGARRRLREDGAGGAAESLVAGLALVSGAITGVAVVFSTVAILLPPTIGDAAVDAAFRAEQRLIGIESFIDDITPPWFVTWPLLLGLFILSARRSSGEPTTTARLASAAHQRSRPILKAISVAQLVLSVAGGLTIFGTSLDVDTRGFRLRLRKAEEQIQKVGAAAAVIGSVAAREAAAQSVVATPPEPAKELIETLDRRNEDLKDLEDEQAAAENNLHVRFYPSFRRVPPSGAGGSSVASPPGDSSGTAPRPPPADAAETTEFRKRVTFERLERAEAIVVPQAESSELARRIEYLTQLETRKAFTGEIIQTTLRAPWISLIEGAGLSPLSDAIARAVVDVIAEAMNDHIDSRVTQWLLKGLTTGDVAAGGDPFAQAVAESAKELTSRGVADRGRQSVAQVVAGHTDALAQVRGQAESDIEAINADRSSLSDRVSIAESALEARRGEAVAKLRSSLAPRRSPVTAMDFWRDPAMIRERLRLLKQPALSPELVDQFIELKSATPLTVDAVAALEAEAIRVEEGAVPKEVLPPEPKLEPKPWEPILPRPGGGRIFEPVPGGRVVEPPIYKPPPPRWRPRVIPRR